MQLIYASRPFGYDELTLTSILMQARKNNARNGITGALICREDLFLQILEGPRDLVTATFSRILRDERHVDVVNLLSNEIHGRLFPEWSMRHDPAQSWMWTPEEVARGAIGRASDQEILGTFESLAKEPANPNGQLISECRTDTTEQLHRERQTSKAPLRVGRSLDKSVRVRTGSCTAYAKRRCVVPIDDFH
jgi:hypothetical protein